MFEFFFYNRAKLTYISVNTILFRYQFKHPLFRCMKNNLIVLFFAKHIFSRQLQTSPYILGWFDVEAVSKIQ